MFLSSSIRFNSLLHLHSSHWLESFKLYGSFFFPFLCFSPLLQGENFFLFFHLNFSFNFLQVEKLVALTLNLIRTFTPHPGGGGGSGGGWGG